MVRKANLGRLREPNLRDERSPGVQKQGSRRQALRPLLLFPLACLGIVATGCLELEIGANVKGDGSGTLSVDMTLDPMTSSLLLMGGDIEDADDVMDDAPEVGSELMEGTTITRVDVVERDGRVVFDLEADFEDPDALSLAMTSETEGEAMFEEFTLVSSESNWELNAIIHPAFIAEMTPGADASADPEGPSEDFGDFEDLMEGALTPAKIDFSMTFPGNVESSNATSVDGNTATWDLTDASITQLTATAGPAGFPTMLLAGAIGGLLVLGLLGWLLIARSRRVPAVGSTGQYPLPPAAPGAYPAAPGAYPAAPPTAQPAAVPDAWADEKSETVRSESAGVPGAGVEQPVAQPVAAAGWYPDPKGEATSRYWDGTTWTDHVSS